MTIEELVVFIQEKFDEELSIEVVPNTSPECLSVTSKDLIQIMRFLHESKDLYFDSLSCITGIDNGPESGQIEVVYNLYSIPYDKHLMVQVPMERDNPVIDSLTSIWKTANWHEREAYDLLGIQFEGHPDLRRILMPADWEGFPLRKDYKEQTYYRGMKVKF